MTGRRGLSTHHRSPRRLPLHITGERSPRLAKHARAGIAIALRTTCLQGSRLTCPALSRLDGGLGKEATTPPTSGQLSVATLNVQNLDAKDPQSKFDALAGQIVTNLASPGIIALQEIQDNNGPEGGTPTPARPGPS
ncbi:hypothetical protein SSP24_78590 [Streptomyces spinoverrucosus]|uniref:Endonuclease/exonuclease/phosphatase domain-containing protein n=1 Tax=Streptomyces spinoverrucosus TaxID=284043 RepID=A0A4Y3VT95_9ACTN|nr:hypothetical protein [Streptomyces spinoverrucosus]GEC10204.1 hypothetical protein SSP24_78590 [Streptomyces spinoverrucosus]GHB98288.1 hypothetical protein GCM10010397_83430 [Streptomyces spinoverrucosus]